MQTDVYINQEQFDQIITLLQQIANKQAEIHTVNAHLLITVIMFIVIWIWTVFAIEAILKPVGDN